jgi:maleylacetate reductase
MDAFVYQSAPVRVVFGSGTIAQLPAEFDRLSITRALLGLEAQDQARGFE